MTRCAQAPDGGPVRAVSLATIAFASSSVRAGRRPMAMSGMPVPLKSANQSSEAVFMYAVGTSLVGTKSWLPKPR